MARNIALSWESSLSRGNPGTSFGSVQQLGQGLDGGATVSQGPGKGNTRCASSTLTGVSLASVETGLAPVFQRSRKYCLAGGGASGTARNLGAWNSRLGDVEPLSFRFSLSFLDKLGPISQVWER